MGRLNFSFRRQYTPPPPSPGGNPPPPPPEFVCPISGDLMADPVIISTGETFDRICIESLQNLSFNSSSSSSSLLIPNAALRAAILRWCDDSCVAHPITLSSETADCFARRFVSSSSSSKSVLFCVQPSCSTKLLKEKSSSITCSSSSSSSEHYSFSSSTEIIPLRTPESLFLPPNFKMQTSCSTKLPNEKSSSFSSSDHSSSSSSSSNEINPLKTPNSDLLSSNTKLLATCSTQLPNVNTSSCSSSSTEIIPDPIENNILQQLKDAQSGEQHKALISLLEATRESTSRRISLCSANLLSALRRLLVSHSPAVQSTTLAIIINLSIEPPNKIPIVRSGSVPSIINLLQYDTTKNNHRNMIVTENAATALFSLSLEEQNRTAIGVLGAIPPLLALFCNPNEISKPRIEAGTALHYLVLDEMNMKKLARVFGAAKGLVAVATGDEKESELRKLAMRLMVAIAGCNEGKNAIFDGGAMEAIVEILSQEHDDLEDEKEMVIMILYGISTKALRFRGIARRIGIEQVLERIVERLEGDKRDMVRMIIGVIRGEEGKERDLGRILFAGG